MQLLVLGRDVSAWSFAELGEPPARHELVLFKEANERVSRVALDGERSSAGRLSLLPLLVDASGRAHPRGSVPADEQHSGVLHLADGAAAAGRAVLDDGRASIHLAAVNGAAAFHARGDVAAVQHGVEHVVGDAIVSGGHAIARRCIVRREEEDVAAVEDGRHDERQRDGDGVEHLIARHVAVVGDDVYDRRQHPAEEVAVHIHKAGGPWQTYLGQLNKSCIAKEAPPLLLRKKIRPIVCRAIVIRYL